ncbi:isocitrate lyase/PEP mutase family protein [Aurantimonas sp. C2-6-R+9]|uniref:isocitrate lyase/PEP mutase family protein n=1 Tax=unclassified Aurantimonas TaxID=2638230 RepID=UPI002E19FD7A|nr:MULTISPECIES: isocitrate lyase/PEP mutase family protein [unclassified Aurantimonas]MEC5290559.1 isocitrate lyase/PEP mutase family protein [Aurantimonas sp. C2-3-R2]MEC5380432.1 isocitrate lyase/PEP mutase family protein [Aurantimonas sp. C2-6-R+9]MEC5411478.1 isocitrate lyase/PEP mutase family protein [Aurantimonas sp. C2-4-R8]
MANPALKAAIARKDFILAPGIYDLISALIADRMGFPALYVTGYGTVASSLGLPDAGIATYSDMLGRIAQMARMTETPIIADADTGYGGLLNVHHTVRGYEAAGVSAIQLEDQMFPKKCGHTPTRQVVPSEEMVRKIQVAVDSRQSDDFLVIARTDARTALGLDEAIRRAVAYGEAGADLIFVESPESVDEMARIGREIDRPLIANMVNGGRTPLLPADELQALGFAVAIHPAAGFLSAAAALQTTYADLKANGINTDRTELYSFADFNQLIGFEDVWAFDRRYAV